MNTTKMVAATMLVAATLAGCGDSDDVAEGPTPAATAAAATTAPAGTSATTPANKLESVPQADPNVKVGKKEGAWAERLCTELAGKTTAITPPQVDTSSPSGTLTSLRTFFGSVVKEQGSQLKALETVGAPPGSKAETEWKKAVDELRDVRKEVSGVVEDLDGASASNAEEVQAVISKLGTQLKSLSGYGGPVPALFSNATIGPALLAEPTCSKFS